MPREPANPFGLRWSSTAAEIFAAGPPPGCGLLCAFGQLFPHWWPVAANDER